MNLENATLEELKEYCKKCMCKMKKTYPYEDLISRYKYTFEAGKYYPVFINEEETVVYSFDRECYVSWSHENAKEWLEI